MSPSLKQLLPKTAHEWVCNILLALSIFLAFAESIGNPTGNDQQWVKMVVAALYVFLLLRVWQIDKQPYAPQYAVQQRIYAILAILAAYYLFWFAFARPAELVMMLENLLFFAYQPVLLSRIMGRNAKVLWRVGSFGFMLAVLGFSPWLREWSNQQALVNALQEGWAWMGLQRIPMFLATSGSLIVLAMLEGFWRKQTKKPKPRNPATS